MNIAISVGLLNGVMPPSTNRNECSPSCISSGSKYVGAAVLARSSCQIGIFKLQSGSDGSLKLAFGLLLIGQGEPVEAFRMTISRRVSSRLDPRSAGSLPSAPSQNLRANSRAMGSDRYFLFQRLYQCSFANISGPHCKYKSSISRTAIPHERQVAMMAPVLVPANRSNTFANTRSSF